MIILPFQFQYKIAIRFFYDKKRWMSGAKNAKELERNANVLVMFAR